MLNFLKKTWFFAGIFVVMLLSFTLPELGRLVRDYSILNIGIFLAFFITGLSLETSGIGSQLRNYKALAAAMKKAHDSRTLRYSFLRIKRLNYEISVIIK